MKIIMQDFSAEFERLTLNTTSERLRELRKIGLSAFDAGLKSVDPDRLIKNSLQWEDKEDLKNLTVIVQGFNGTLTQRFQLDLRQYGEVLIIGGGKATGTMARSVINILSKKIPCYGLINIPHEQEHGDTIKSKIDSSKEVILNYSAHPIPDQHGLNGTKKMIELVTNASEKTFVITLISGGGSALMPFPREDVSLSELQEVNRILIESGATINEINAVRKHLSNFKGGNLARAIYPKKSISLIISDVIGNPLDVIASGPTVPDPSTFNDANAVFKKYTLQNKLPKSVFQTIERGISGIIEETPKPGEEIFSKNINLIIGSADVAKAKMTKVLESCGCKNIEALEIAGLPTLNGEASEFADQIISIIEKFNQNQEDHDDGDNASTYYSLNSGEFTVTIRGDGIGGRNQEMLLGLLKKLRVKSFRSLEFIVISVAFDGIEGNSPAAGALIDSDTLRQVPNQISDINGYLENNNSYSFFKKIGSAIETGQTGTNTNDICLVLLKKTS